MCQYNAKSKKIIGKLIKIQNPPSSETVADEPAADKPAADESAADKPTTDSDPADDASDEAREATG